MANGTKVEDLSCQLHPFERNRYFYGKLLTTRDFETEQRYFNEKRHLLNRFVDGSGVVCGLKVEALNESSVRIAPGVAIDCCGREIVVSREYTIDISELDGFRDNFSGEEIYLCLMYDECIREPVPALANPSTCEEICDYNRIQESFKVVIKEDVQPPEIDFCTSWTESQTLFQNDQIRVERIAPSWVNPKEVFEVKLVVTALQNGVTETISVTETLPSQLTLIQGLDADNRMSLSLTAAAEGSVVEGSYLLRAAETTGTPVIGVDEVQVGGSSVTVSDDPISTVEIIDEPISGRVVERYFEERLNPCPECPDDLCIYLAKLRLSAGQITANDVQSIPQAQYVYNSRLLYELMTCAERRIGQIPEIAVKDDEMPVLPAVNSFNFLGGLDAADGGQGEADISANVGNGLQIVGDQIQANVGDGLTIDAGQIKLDSHGDTHQEGGVDEITGVLVDAQKVAVQDEGSSVGTSTTLNFTGDGVSVSNDADNQRINIDIRGGASRVFTGTVTVTLGDGGILSPLTVSVNELQSNEPFAVILAPQLPAGTFPIDDIPTLDPTRDGAHFVYGSILNDAFNRIFVAFVPQPYQRTFEIHGHAPQFGGLTISIVYWVIAGAQRIGNVVLNGDQEVDPVETDATGTATVNLVDRNLHFSITVTGLSGPITGAHFHGPATESENAGVLFDITDTFDGETAHGVWEGLTDEQIKLLSEGTMYLNIHTAANPPGEIRGQVHLNK